MGKGFLEAVYKDALKHEFNLKGIPFVTERKFEIIYKCKTLDHYYFSDFIVFDKIVIEVKAQQNIIDKNLKQTINYLAASKMKLGLLINFGEDSLKFKRVIL